MTHMKKYLLISLVAFAAMFCGVLRAQTVQYSLDLEPFSAIEVSGPFRVSLVSGSQYRTLISVLEPYKEFVECSASAGVLSLTLDEKKVPSEIKKKYRAKGTPDPVYDAIIYVPELIRSVHLSGKAVLHDTEDLFDKARASFEVEGNAAIEPLALSSLIISLDVKGKGTADMKVSCRESEVRLAGSGVINLSGDAQECDWQVQGPSKFNANVSGGNLFLAAKGNSDSFLSGTAESAKFDIGGTAEVDASRMEVTSANVTMSSVCKLSVNALQTLKVNLNGGSTLLFAGEPSIVVDNIRSATMSHLKVAAITSGKL